MAEVNKKVFGRHLKVVMLLAEWTDSDSKMHAHGHVNEAALSPSLVLDSQHDEIKTV